VGFLEEGFVDIVCGGAVKVLGVHGLGRDDFLVLRGFVSLMGGQIL